MSLLSRRKPPERSEAIIPLTLTITILFLAYLSYKRSAYINNNREISCDLVSKDRQMGAAHASRPSINDFAATSRIVRQIS